MNQSSKPRLNYYSSCVDWPRHLVESPGGLCDMVDSLQDITRRTFTMHVDQADRCRLEASLGYASHPSRGLTITEDYHLRYARGTLHGRRVYVLVHSAIEYVFAPFSPGDEPSTSQS